ncbi:unnamed protein product [Coregonus sp. 'balchen']|nr:unnamed protein product [Coregonus sp. 'balchen']
MQRASLMQMLMCRRSEQQGAGFLVYRMITKPSWWKSRRPCTGCMLERRQRDQGQAESQIESMEQEVTMPFPFACVDAVSQGSPACQAVISDEIIAFGSVNTRNFQNLQNIASVVQHKTIKRYIDSKRPEDPNGPYPTAVVRERFTGM